MVQILLKVGQISHSCGLPEQPVPCAFLSASCMPCRTNASRTSSVIAIQAVRMLRAASAQGTRNWSVSLLHLRRRLAFGFHPYSSNRFAMSDHVAKDTDQAEHVTRTEGQNDASDKTTTKCSDSGSPDSVPVRDKVQSAAMSILVLRDAKGAIDFYKKALGAKCTFCYPADNGLIMHAFLEVSIGKGFVFAVEDEGAMPEMVALSHCQAPTEGTAKATGSYMYITVEGKNACDAATERMREAGATVVMPPKDFFYGSRMSNCIDPYGIAWSFNEPIEVPNMQEIWEKGMVKESDSNDHK